MLRVVAVPDHHIILQARATSTRLPKKVLLPLCGRTVLEVMLRRLWRFRCSLIVATTNDGSEQEIVALCDQLGIACFRGDTEDVLGRFCGALRQVDAQPDDVVVRLTSDCPLFDSDLLESALQRFEQAGVDYLSNTIKRTFPRGMDFEIMRVRVLCMADEEAKLPYQREHVTPFIHQQPERFGLENFAQQEDHSAYRLTLDEVDDYQMIKQLYDLLGCRMDFGYVELLEMLRQHPEVAAMNAHVEQKKL